MTMDQEIESDRKHRLKTDDLGNQDEEVFAIHKSLGGGFIDDKSGNDSTSTRLWSNEVFVKRSWLRESPVPSLSTMFFKQTKVHDAFVRDNRNIIPTNDIRRGS